MKVLIGVVTVLLLIIGCATKDTDMHPVLSESVVNSAQWMGGFIVNPSKASTQ